jgi:anaphase-promoting complex subunit 1
MPGTATGATTPVHGSQQTFRESFSQHVPTLGNKKIRQEESKDKVSDLVSTLDPDYEGGSLPRRKSRRVSSMLARSDLSANNERSAFTDLATGHSTMRRTESLGHKHPRISVGSFQGVNGHVPGSAFNQSLNSYLEAPVDDLLDELRAGGDFEGFHNMGLDDDEFDALRQEIVLSKVCSVSAEHTTLRYSSQHMPAKAQSKIFTLTAPPSASDEQNGKAVVICILDSDEKKLLVLTLNTKTHKTAGSVTENNMTDQDITVVSLGSVMRAKGVIDACRLDDGQVSRILVLTQTPDGYGELSLQAPWSVLMKVPLPAKFTISNMRNLGHDATPKARREGGFKRVLSQGPRSLDGLKNAKPQGVVDLVDDTGRMHQLQIVMEPRNPHVKAALEMCRSVAPGHRGGEGVLVCWWHVMQWFRLESLETEDVEWSAFVVTMFAMVLSISNRPQPSQKRGHAKRKSKSGFLRSSSGAQANLENWEAMFRQETENGNPFPPWADNSAWRWLAEDNELGPPSTADSKIFKPYEDDTENTAFVVRHVKIARSFVSTTFGSEAVQGCLPCCGDRLEESRKAALSDIFVGLHLLNEECKLNTMSSDSFSIGTATLLPILMQIGTWLGWKSWIDGYEVEQGNLINVKYDTGLSSPKTYLISTYVFFQSHPCWDLYQSLSLAHQYMIGYKLAYFPSNWHLS